MGNKQYKFVDLSGYMFSGKHALNLLIEELHGFGVHQWDLEFNLLRIQGGIMDLEKALVEDWSIIRSNSAIRRFRNLVKKFDCSYTKFPYKYFNFYTDFYQTRFGNKFTELSEKYINNLVSSKWNCEWPYPYYDMCEFEVFSRKIKKRFTGHESAFENEFNLVDGKDFYRHTKEYLMELLSNYEGVTDDTSTLVTNNAFEPFNAKRGLRYFDNAKCIIVRRDPRDMYVTGSNHSRLYAKISHGEKVENFIRRFEIQERNTDKTPHDNVMFLQYEELILDYEATIRKIFDFLGVDDSLHTRKRQSLRPEESERFIGIYKGFKNQNDIGMIEEKLADYCLNI